MEVYPCPKNIECSVLRRWKNQIANDPENAFPGKRKQKAADKQMKKLQRERERVKEERDILEKALAFLAEDQK